ncbi:VOC family protein [Motilibacter peucedani]|uniref:VOC family protein n=1 Tax=Motilibacter peucedani TaxID=598650 RepID=UPI000EAE3D61|nr:VOC family protein [Motilibacter peucedani]
MTLRPVQVNIKASSDAALGRFWAGALGWVVDDSEPGVTSVVPADASWPVPDTLTIDLVPVPDLEAVRTRLHLELATTSGDHHSELLARVQGLGATVVGTTDDGCRTVLADPEGGAFCVLAPQDHDRTGPIAALVVECADPQVLAAFWSDALGWVVAESGERVLLRASTGAGPCLELVGSSHLPATLASHAHVDLLPDPVDAKPAEVARLLELGAANADVGQGDVPWAVMADPEGNEFCVLGRP